MNANDILPEDPKEAIAKMIEITESLKDFMEKEYEAMCLGDSTAFMIAEKDKQEAAWKYEGATREFKARIDDLKGKVDTSSIGRLDQLQKELKAIAQKSAEMMSKVKVETKNVL